MSFRIDRCKREFKVWWDYDVARLWYNLTHLRSKEPSPHSHAGLDTPLSDLSHSYVNLFVELFRGNAYLLGHLVAVGIPLYAVFCIVRLFL